MGIVSSIVLYFLIWWTVIFTTLPFGNRPSETVTIGHAGSAPARPNLKKKLVATTIIAFLLWLAINPLVHWGLDRLRADARAMAVEDGIHENK
jgi:predicted secreted protein